jgi:uncharacterized membrane protein YcaP (DUF421 family)
MDSVINAVVVYVFLRLVIGLTGRRNLAQLTAFELVLLIVIGGAVQRALVGDDPSLTNAAIIVATLIGLDLLMSLIARRSYIFSRILQGVPLVIVENGRPLARRLHRAHLSEDDVLAAARRHHGLTTIDEVKYAILEANGDISIVPERTITTPRDRAASKMEK